jgi:putative ABC transport system substrate-binding protein
MQFDRLRRREFLGVLGGAAAAWPCVARAQQSAIPVIGVMAAGARGQLRAQLAAFEEGLNESSYAAGRSVAIEYHYAEGKFDRFPVFASELVRRQVNVLVVASNQGAFAAKQATATIPIVFIAGGDPIASGLVTSLNRPAGNMTGVYQFLSALEAKRLGLLHEMVPTVTTIGALVNPNYADAEDQVREVQEAARRLGVGVIIVRANTEGDFETAFSTLIEHRAGALLVCASPFFNSRREQLVVLTARYGIPATASRKLVRSSRCKSGPSKE